MLAAMLSSFEETSRLLNDKGVSLGINMIDGLPNTTVCQSGKDLTAHRAAPIWRVIRPAARGDIHRWGGEFEFERTSGGLERKRVGGAIQRIGGAQAAYHLHGR